VVLETDAQRATPAGVEFHYTRVLNSEDTPDQLRGMIDESGRAAWLLSHARVTAIGFGCTSGSFLEGPDYDRAVVSTMEAAAGVRSITTTGAVVDALRALNVRSVQVLAPYEPWLTERCASFLQASGFEVVASSSLGLVDPHEMLAMTGPAIVDWASSEFNQNSEGLFISCTNMRALDAIGELERRLARPIVTSNAALLWGLFAAAGLQPPYTGVGSFLASTRPGAAPGERPDPLIGEGVE
jgi:maleate isomerase